MAFLFSTEWVFSLPIPYGMHLVVPTHPYFFWRVCHPNRTFPPKEPEQEPLNRISPLPITRPYPFLPLTHDPLLLVLARYRLVMFRPCECSTSVYVQNLSAAHAFAVVWRIAYTSYHLSLTSYGVSYFLISHALWPAPFKGQASLDCGHFLLQPTLLLLPQSCYHSCHTTLPFLLYHSAIPVVMLFNPSLLGFFGPTAYSSLNDSIWSLDSYSCYFGLFFFYIACGLLYPIYFFLGILGSFAFLGHPWPFFLILCSHGLLLTLLDFPSPITLSFILGAHGLSINPLLSLLALIRVCYGPFSLFYNTYYPQVCYFSLRAPLGPFAFSRLIYLLYRPMIHYSCHSGLMVFSNHSLTLLCPYCWASSFYQASQNKH